MTWDSANGKIPNPRRRSEERQRIKNPKPPHSKKRLRVQSIQTNVKELRYEM
jgi:hypothetical protein